MMGTQAESLSATRLRSLLSYATESGEFRWLVAVGSRTRAGALAGCRRSDGRGRIRIDGRCYLTSRLAWLYVTGSWPDRLVDHENRNKSDDRWTNLRLATPSENNANAGKRARNTSGFKGVTWVRKRRKWQAQLAVQGKNIFLGMFEDIEVAAGAYRAAARKYFGEFAST